MECTMDTSVDDRKLFDTLVESVGIGDDLDGMIVPTGWNLLSFDPPSSSNLGWACFSVDSDDVARLECSGVYRIPDGTGQRLLAIERFVELLIERYPGVSVMCFERAIGNGFAPVREKIGENTGVIKLAGARSGVDFVAVHTSTMAKVFTGSGSSDGKKSRIKRTAKDMFFPGSSYREIAPDGEGGEKFEHQADAIGMGCCHLMKNGIRIEGPGGTLLPIESGEDEEDERTGSE